MNHKLFKFIANFFIIFLLFSPLKGAANNVGVIDQLVGEIYFIDENSKEKIIIGELDDITLNVEYLLNSSTNVVFSLLDGTTINFEKGISFEVIEYEDILSTNPHYVIKMTGGLFLIETGELPKINKNSSKINTPLGQLVLNGTAISADFTQEVPQIFLMTDSFGEEGELLIETQEGTVSVEPNSGVSIGSEGKLETRAIDENIINKQQEFKNTIVETSIPDSDKIKEIIEKKILSGSLKDLNGDGTIDDKDKEILLESITKQKNSKIDTILQNTKNDPALIGEIVKKSKDENSTALLEKMIDKKPEMLSKVAEKVLEENADKFSKMLEAKPELSTKVIETIVKSASENDNSISIIVAKADSKIAEKLLENVADNKKELLTKIISESSEISSSNISEITKNNETLSNKVSEAIVEKVLESPNANDELKKLILQGNESITSKIIENIEKTDPKLTTQAISESMKENSEKLVEKLSNSLESNNMLSKKIIAESIKTGQTDLVIAASELTQKKINETRNQSTNAISNTSQSINNSNAGTNKTKQAEVLESLSRTIKEQTKLLIEDNPNMKIEIDNNLFKDLNATLASPN